MLSLISSALVLTGVQRTQLVKKVILSVDMLAFSQMELHISACLHSGGGASRSSFVLSLELSRSSLNGMISEQAVNNPFFLHDTLNAYA
jgi:hypothetical protein